MHGFAPALPKNVYSKPASGSFMCSTTVYLSGSSTFRMRSQPSRLTSLFAGLRTTLIEKTTSSASKGAPSDHLTPRRKWYVIVLPSLLIPPLACVGTTVASPGIARFRASVFVNQAIVSDDMYASVSCCSSCGLRLLMSCPVAKRRTWGIVRGRRACAVAPLAHSVHSSATSTPNSAHRFRINPVVATKRDVGGRRDLRRFDLAPPAPKDVGVSYLYPGLGQVAVDRGLVRQDDVLFGPVRDAHDVDVVKLRAAFTPVGVRHDVMPADLAPCVELAAGRDRPMEERVIPRDASIPCDRFDVLEEGRKPADDAAPFQSVRDAIKRGLIDARFFGAYPPNVADDLMGRKFALERREDTPLELVELDDLRRDGVGQDVGPTPGFETFSTNVTDAEREEFLGRHQAEALRTDPLCEITRVLLDREALGNLERRPEAVLRPGGEAVRRTDDDMTGKRILGEHEVEGRVELLRRNLPGRKRPGGEVRRHQRLPHPSNRPGLHHRDDPLEDGFDRDARARRDLTERILEKTGDAVLGDGEDGGVDRIVDPNGKRTRHRIVRL